MRDDDVPFSCRLALTHVTFMGYVCHSLKHVSHPPTHESFIVNTHSLISQPMALPCSDRVISVGGVVLAGKSGA